MYEYCLEHYEDRNSKKLCGFWTRQLLIFGTKIRLCATCCKTWTNISPIDFASQVPQADLSHSPMQRKTKIRMLKKFVSEVFGLDELGMSALGSTLLTLAFVLTRFMRLHFFTSVLKFKVMS